MLILFYFFFIQIFSFFLIISDAKYMMQENHVFMGKSQIVTVGYCMIEVIFICQERKIHMLTLLLCELSIRC